MSTSTAEPDLRRSRDSSASATEAPTLVLFAFDGVLMRGNAFHQLLRRRYARAPWRVLLAVLCAPVLLAQVALSRLAAGRTLSRIALLGVREQHYQRLVEAHAADVVRRSSLCCRDGVRALRRHLAAGDQVIVVTACEQRLVQAIFRELGMPDLRIVATQWRARWYGMQLAWHNMGDNKVRRLAHEGIEAWQVACSNSLRDLPLLRQAQTAVLVNATAARCRKAEKALGHALTRVHWY